MTFFLNRTSRSPYPRQVVRQAVAQLFAGRLNPGDRLPSVRQLARELDISRTTAERILDALGDSMLAEVRPRSGAFVAPPQTQMDGMQPTTDIQAVYGFLKETVARARNFGLDTERLIQTLRAFEENGLEGAEPQAVFPLVASAEFYECAKHCLGREFPANLVHLPAGVQEPRVPPGTRYILSSYYLLARAQKFAASLRCSLLYVRYNVKLLDESMNMGPGEHRYFVTRDKDNAAMTPVFLGSAYPEVSPDRYSVLIAEDALREERLLNGDGEVWATVTAARHLAGRIDSKRLRVLHPLLAEDFIDELRCLALLR